MGKVTKNEVKKLKMTSWVHKRKSCNALKIKVNIILDAVRLLQRNGPATVSRLKKYLKHQYNVDVSLIKQSIMTAVKRGELLVKGKTIVISKFKRIKY